MLKDCCALVLAGAAPEGVMPVILMAFGYNLSTDDGRIVEAIAQCTVWITHGARYLSRPLRTAWHSLLESIHGELEAFFRLMNNLRIPGPFVEAGHRRIWSAADA